MSSIKSLRFMFARKISKILLENNFPLNRTIREKSSKIITPKPKDGLQVVPTIYNFDVNLNPRQGGLPEERMYWLGENEAGTLSTFKDIINKGETVYDIGAHIGLISIKASKEVGETGRVYSFEANPSTFSILEKNITLNGLENVQAFNVGLGDSSQTRKIFRHENSNRGTSSFLATDTSEEISKIKIEKLDDLFKEENMKPPNFIKIDVEGFELKVLKGAETLLREHTPKICVEVSELHEQASAKPKEVLGFISSVGEYKFYVLGKGKSQPSELVEIDLNEFPEHGNVFCLPNEE